MPEEEKPCEVHKYQIGQHENRLNKIDEILDKIRNRLPIWATFVLGALLALIGYLISFAKATK